MVTDKDGSLCEAGCDCKGGGRVAHHLKVRQEAELRWDCAPQGKIAQVPRQTKKWATVFKGSHGARRCSHRVRRGIALSTR